MCPPPIKSKFPSNAIILLWIDDVHLPGDGSWWWILFIYNHNSAHPNVWFLFPAGEDLFLYLRKNPQFQGVSGVRSGRVRLISETVCTGGRGGGAVLIMSLTDTTSKTVITNVKREKRRKSPHPERLLFDLTDVPSVWDLHMFHDKNKRTWTLVEHCERSSGLVCEQTWNQKPGESLNLWLNLETKLKVCSRSCCPEDEMVTYASLRTKLLFFNPRGYWH